MKFSIIVPTLNEQLIIEDCIRDLRRMDRHTEIIIADGGSNDKTVEIAQSLGVRVCHSRQGRGIQCNAGAKAATSEILVFLHADTRLPDDAVRRLEKIFDDPILQCGTFKISFDYNHWFLRFLSGCALLLGFFRFGDQGLVIRKAFFDLIGGYPDWKLYEDIEIARRARKRTRVKRFPMAVRSSARRFIENGIIRQQILNTWYTLRYLAGTSTEKLAADYSQRRPSFQGSVLNILVKYPRPGQVKTRLAASTGDEAAVNIYRKCVRSLIQACYELPKTVQIQVWFTGGHEREMVDWLGRGLTYIVQPEGDLGDRLSYAFDHSFRVGAKKVITVASDVPELSADLIVRGFRTLDSVDSVIGPSVDGGYYLVGMKKMHPSFFEHISWGTTAVRRQTMDAARAHGISLRLLPELSDIDNYEDLLSLRRRIGRRKTRRARQMEVETF